LFSRAQRVSPRSKLTTRAFGSVSRKSMAEWPALKPSSHTVTAAEGSKAAVSVAKMNLVLVIA
jgi:hypothetical protein